MKSKYLGIEINRSKDKEMTDQANDLLKAHYLRGKEKSPQEAYARACVAYSGGDLDLAQRLYDGVSDGWFMFSSPILSNAPSPGEIPLGLPISCFLNYVPDTLEGLIDHQSELAWLSVKGGGVGGHWSDVRAVSDKAPSPIPFITMLLIFLTILWTAFLVIATGILLILMTTQYVTRYVHESYGKEYWRHVLERVNHTYTSSMRVIENYRSLLKTKD